MPFEAHHSCVHDGVESLFAPVFNSVYPLIQETVLVDELTVDLIASEDVVFLAGIAKENYTNIGEATRDPVCLTFQHNRDFWTSHCP